MNAQFPVTPFIVHRRRISFRIADNPADSVNSLALFEDKRAAYLSG